MFGALIVAAGSGSRMGGTTPKQFLQLKGKPVLLHTIEKFLSPEIFFHKIVIVIPPGSMGYCRDFVFESADNLSEHLVLVEGGKERQDSVYKGLLMLGGGMEVVCIHDGVRPLVSSLLIKEAVNAALEKGAVVPVVPLKDTLKEVDPSGNVIRTLSRDRFRLVQTPQCFRMQVILDAFAKAKRDNIYATDDAALVEKNGFKVSHIPGEPENIKITAPEDLVFAESILERRESDVQGRNRL